MKKSLVASISISNAAFAQLVADAKQEISWERGEESPLTLEKDECGWPWYNLTVRVPDDEAGLMFLAESVAHGHYNQASPADNPKAGCRLIKVGNAYVEHFDLPTFVVGTCSMGDRFVSQGIKRSCWVGYDNQEDADEDGGWTFVHSIYVLRTGLPVGENMKFASATSDSSVTMQKVTRDTWEVCLSIPCREYAGTAYTDEETGEYDGDEPYYGWYHRVFTEALDRYQAELERTLKAESAEPLTWSLAELVTKAIA